MMNITFVWMRNFFVDKFSAAILEKVQNYIFFCVHFSFPCPKVSYANKNATSWRFIQFLLVGFVEVARFVLVLGLVSFLLYFLFFLPRISLHFSNFSHSSSNFKASTQPKKYSLPKQSILNRRENSKIENSRWERAQEGGNFN